MLVYMAARPVAPQASVAKVVPPVMVATSTPVLSMKKLVPLLVKPSSVSHTMPFKSAMPHIWPLCVVRAMKLALPVLPQLYVPLPSSTKAMAPSLVSPLALLLQPLGKLVLLALYQAQ